jgi:MFS family permease
LAFGSLGVRNYRLYFFGQIVSVSGNWMQQVAIAWLVLRLTNSAFELGITVALQTVPYLFFGVWGGLIADRLPKRKLLLCTQVAQIVPPTALWILSHGHLTQIWMVYPIVIVRGFINVFDNPARQSFVIEMVGPERIINGVSLNASVIQTGRLVGPALAGLIIATLGLGPCFLLNAATFVFMVLMLLLMRPEELNPAPVAPRGRGQLRAGFSLAARTPELRLPLVSMAIVGLLAFNFTVVLPAVARFTFHGSATTYALMVNFLAVGALGGAVVSSTRRGMSAKVVPWAALAFGAALGLASIVDDLAVMLVALLVVGATSVTFSAAVQTTLQLSAAPEMRGRIVSFYQLVYMGTTPLGALLVGALASSEGARSGLVVGSIGALVTGAGGVVALSRRRRATGPSDPREGDAELGAGASRRYA